MCFLKIIHFKIIYLSILMDYINKSDTRKNSCARESVRMKANAQHSLEVVACGDARAAPQCNRTAADTAESHQF